MKLHLKSYKKASIRTLFLFLNISLQNNADQPAAALVDDFLQGLLQLHLGILRHTVDFILHPIADHGAEGAPKNIQIPDLFRFFLIIGDQMIDKFS